MSHGMDKVSIYSRLKTKSLRISFKEGPSLAANKEATEPRVPSG
jgi:hypothetical protein